MRCFSPLRARCPTFFATFPATTPERLKAEGRLGNQPPDQKFLWRVLSKILAGGYVFYSQNKIPINKKAISVELSCLAYTHKHTRINIQTKMHPRTTPNSSFFSQFYLEMTSRTFPHSKHASAKWFHKCFFRRQNTHWTTGHSFKYFTWF